MNSNIVTRPSIEKAEYRKRIFLSCKIQNFFEPFVHLTQIVRKKTFGISSSLIRDFFQIRDLDLGSQFPEIKNIRLHNVDLHQDEQHIESLDVLLDLSYEGNFRLAIDADMVLGKKGSLSVKGTWAVNYLQHWVRDIQNWCHFTVRQVSGIARLQFTRKPYTHWSLSFVGDPKVDLEVQSQFQGRQMQSNVTSLISNQIRKAIRRKHTLPNYKLRYVLEFCGFNLGNDPWIFP